jgi:hypothetical protein
MRKIAVLYTIPVRHKVRLGGPDLSGPSHRPMHSGDIYARE